MFEPNEERQNKIAALIVTLKAVEIGSLLEYEQIMETHGFDPQRGWGYGLVKAARDKLEREGVVFVVETDKGLRRIVDAAVIHLERRLQRIRGQAKRRKFELSGVDPNALSAAEQTLFASELVRAEITETTAKNRGKPLVLSGLAKNPAALRDAAKDYKNR